MTSPTAPLQPRSRTASVAPTVGTHRDAPMRGLLLMLAAATMFVVMNALARSLASGGAIWPLAAFARALGGMLFALLVARWRKASLKIHDRKIMWQRSIFGSISMLLTFFALSRLPLPIATALLNTTPLWITLLAWLTLREAAGTSVLLALGVALVGVVLVQRPTLAAGNAAGLVALAAGASSALAMVSLRRLRNETPEAVVVHFSALASVITGGLLAVGIARYGAPHIDAWMLLKLLGVGATATLGQLAMTRAYALDRAARVGAAGWVQIVLASVLDITMHGTLPPMIASVGIVLMMLAGVLLTLSAHRDEQRIRRQAEAETALTAR